MQQDFSTTDTALATFLIVSGHSVKIIDYAQPRFEFTFPHTDGIRELANKYITGQALIEPNAFNRINKKVLRLIAKRIQWEEDWCQRNWHPLSSKSG